MGVVIGKLRGLQQISDAAGFFTICAIDHRGSLQRALNPDNPKAVGYQAMVDFKLDLCRAVVPVASAVLLDPVYGAAPAIAAGVLPGSRGLLVSLEKTGYSGGAEARVSELLPDWGVPKIKRMGASAVKLLVYYRPDVGEAARRKLDLIAGVADECLRADIPLLVEPVSYPVGIEVDDRSLFARRKPELVIETARQITELPIDVLKAEFPVDLNFEDDEGRLLELCRQLGAAARTPWVLLSAGIDFVHFRKQVEIACRAGASGFLAGRALWQEAAGMQPPAARRQFFEEVAAPRLQELSELVHRYGCPWMARPDLAPGGYDAVFEGWYRSYGS